MPSKVKAKTAGVEPIDEKDVDLDPKADEDEADEEEEDDEVGHTKAVVYSHNGGHIRTYSLEDHGTGFKELAKEMADQHAGSRIEHS